MSTINTLRRSLAGIQQDLEDRARSEANGLQHAIVFTGSKLKVPSYSEVGAIWLKLIAGLASEISAEIERVLNAAQFIDEAQLFQIEELVENMLCADNFLERLTVFDEGVRRKAQSFGLPPDTDNSRINLANGLYWAGVHNAIRSANVTIRARLERYVSGRGEQMGLSSLLTDQVSLLKKSGNRKDNIKASVQADQINILGSDILIETGDLIQRNMSNGGQETFEVIDPGFHEKFHSIPAGYQLRVKKLGIPEAQGAVARFEIHVAGNNSRINLNSTDISTNVVMVDPEIANGLNELRRAIQAATLSEAEVKAAAEVVDEVEKQFQSGKPSKTIVSALLTALPHAASIANAVALLLKLF